MDISQSEDLMRPVVSVIIANFNGGRHVEAALKSALDQTLRDIEVIVFDNCSTDDSYALMAAIADQDSRLRVFRTDRNSGGPSIPRNSGIQKATGRWIAIMDSDDLMHPDRLQTLVKRAEHDDADIIADDLFIFSQKTEHTSRCLSDDAEFWVDPAEYVQSNVFYGCRMPLGLLKPLIRSTWLKATRYRGDMHMAEDFDLIIRLLLRGARMKVYPKPMYYYRKHEQSISHRLTKEKLLPTLHYSNDLIQRSRTGSVALLNALQVRHETISMAITFDELVLAIKARDLMKATRIMIRNPKAAKWLYFPLLARLHRLRRLPGIALS